MVKRSMSGGEICCRLCCHLSLVPGHNIISLFYNYIIFLITFFPSFSFWMLIQTLTLPKLKNQLYNLITWDICIYISEVPFFFFFFFFFFFLLFRAVLMAFRSSLAWGCLDLRLLAESKARSELCLWTTL